METVDRLFRARAYAVGPDKSAEFNDGFWGETWSVHGIRNSGVQDELQNTGENRV